MARSRGKPPNESPKNQDSPDQKSEGVFVRFEPEIIEKLRDRAGPTVRGRAGGIPQVVREIVHDFFAVALPASTHGITPPDVARRAREMNSEGLTLKQIAETLQREGFRTARGGAIWDPTQVRRLLAKS